MEDSVYILILGFLLVFLSSCLNSECREGHILEMARDVSKAVVRKDFLILHVRLCVYVLNFETVPSQKRKKKDEFPFVFLNLS